MSTITIPPVRKTVSVAVSPAEAFDAFTARIDRWWPKSHGLGASPLRESFIEPFVGGRWYTLCEDGSEVVVGHVRVWQPAERFVVSWEINAQWKSDARAAFASEVDVRFIGEADGVTRVELEHRDFERMGSPHGGIMRGSVDGGWPGLLALFTSYLTEGERS